mmetsp:Transcript_28173/g.79047  ORF Transcript_28173/g.79047 Transcript_28173/m.79047 type:complete len:115 (-) Transcript_28173:27-371(-)
MQRAESRAAAKLKRVTKHAKEMEGGQEEPKQRNRNPTHDVHSVHITAEHTIAGTTASEIHGSAPSWQMITDCGGNNDIVAFDSRAAFFICCQCRAMAGTVKCSNATPVHLGWTM